MTSSAAQSRDKRIKLYCKTLINSPCTVTSIQKVLGIIDSARIPAVSVRKKNFQRFVDENFSDAEKSFEAINPWPGNKKNLKRIKCCKSMRSHLMAQL